MAKDKPSKAALASKAEERDAAELSGFLREVDEALREEQIVDLIKRYAKPVGGAIAGILGLLAAYLLWQNHVDSVAAERSEKQVIAFDKIQAGKLDEAAKDFEALLKDSKGGDKAVAEMNLAAIAMAQGKSEDAAKRFAAIAADSSLPKPFRDMATFREVSIRFDTMKPDAVIARLKPLAVPGQPFFGPAGELLAVAYMDAGKSDLAGALFAQVSKDNSVSKSVRGRARMMASSLGYDGGGDLPPETPEQAAPAPAPVAKR